VPEDYVHRIGRTGRAGSTGEAISLVAPEEHGLLKDIEKLLKRQLVREAVPGFEPGTAGAPQTPPVRREAMPSARREQPPRRSDGRERRKDDARDARRRHPDAHRSRPDAPVAHRAATHAQPPAPSQAAVSPRPSALPRPAAPARRDAHVPALLRGAPRRTD
jgi:ATP-dependent RNA helicase RhlE